MSPAAVRGSLGTWPHRRARINPHTHAFVEGERAVTFGELDARVDRLARGLRASGVAAGDRVAFLGHNSIALAETMFAAMRIGAIFVPLNTRLTEAELAFITADCTPALLVWTAPHGPAASRLGIAAARLIEADGARYDALLAAEDAAELPDVPIESVAMIQYTSGTSGNPKGVMLSHHNLLWNVFGTLIDTDVVGSDVALVNAPMFHTATLNQVVLLTFIKGGTCVLVAKYDPGETLELIERHRVSYMFGVPTMFAAMAQHPRWPAADLSSIRLLTCGGAPVPPSLTELYRARGLAFQQGYGLTEASPAISFMRADRADADPAATGVPTFFVDVRIADPAGGLLETGSEGEIQARGPNIMVGYWNNPGATADALIDDGWLRTGDIAYLDDAGFVHVVDRLKDMIISGGENIYPAEVEKALVRHDAVAECAVIGVPDATWGEVGRALVVLRDGAEATAEEILGSLDEQLARYKIPRSLIFVDELPHNASGKLVKKRIPDAYRQEHP
ncbi:acyl-CoA synthetase [Cumulibacter manganitolerans]|uniref:acyl-CoA synthetase n=1 Tax=Cumulibacter manganitolerans TaxID=1884992 RepID=UPI001E4B77A5|nr:long-chain fatty acid--CoA ligase [Cumulibacter manganitolerans]